MIQRCKQALILRNRQYDSLLVAVFICNKLDTRHILSNSVLTLTQTEEKAGGNTRRASQ
ncbi:hypothetical protein [Xenorhabdus cabanillasii]|uniref:hypothetical protein n=1 Tax=Xenorhabdus cabanillasii TaxID=351673 RepID=UPI0021002846|nr:hypothetical protein [Xenorhabdus cabanillasii]